MSAYERNGVVVDQCTECRGLFLDRGELERLVEAESGYYGRSPAAAYPGDRPRDLGGSSPDHRDPHRGSHADPDRDRERDRYDDRDRDRDRGDRKSRRRSFLDELFD